MGGMIWRCWGLRPRGVAETRIGVGAIVVRNARVLLGLRRGSHGSDTWAPPGGHLEADESVEQCAARELLEETGIVAHTWRAGPYSVDEFAQIHRRYVTLFVVSTNSDGDAHVREPEKCAQWQWFAWDALPHPLFAPLASVVARGWSPFGAVP